MKKLKDYIIKTITGNYNLDDIIIENELQLHFYAEFIVGDCTFDKIVERYGSYLGQKELVLDLSKKIYEIIYNEEPEDRITVNKDDLSGYSNIFFNELNIYISKKFTGYKSDNSKFISKEKMFDKVDIYLNPKEDGKSYKDVAIAIMHEILHAWNNYQSYLKEAKFNLNKLTDKNSKYYKTLFYDNIKEPNIKDACKRICYNVSQFEQNAYLNELNIELETSDFDVNKYNRIEDAYNAAYDIFINSNVWQQYSSLWEFLNRLKNEFEDKDREEFKNEYNRINSTKLSFSRIYNKLDGLFNKILKTMEKRVPKIFKDYYDEQKKNILKENGGLIHLSNDFVKELKYFALLESIKPDNGLDWEVYVDGKLDKTFTDVAKKWKRKPIVGHGWYCSGAMFKIIKIEGNKVYVREDK